MRDRTFGSESEYVGWLARRLRSQGRGLVLGIGDDAAVVRAAPGRSLILTSDLSIEGTHFRMNLHPADSVGHRALARGLSDVAAMGGTPRYALVSLALSGRTRRDWVERFWAGLRRLARRLGVLVVGGDTAAGSRLVFIDIAVVGDVPARRELRRSGARPRDAIFVSGRLGLSALGLAQLKGRGAGRKLDGPVRAHLYPEPRCALGRFLAERALASSMIDLSDGLSTDLDRLCRASGAGATLREESLPVARGNRASGAKSKPLLEMALHGGEDYELLFTVPPRKVSRLPADYRGLPLHEIGVITASGRLALVERDGSSVPLVPAGYDHFRLNRL